MSNKEQQIEALKQMYVKIAGLRARLQTLSATAVESDDFIALDAGECASLDEAALNKRVGEAAIYLAGLEARVQVHGEAAPLARLGTVCIVLGFVVLLLVGLMFFLKYM